MTEKSLRLVILDLDDTLVAFDLVTDRSWTAICDLHAPRYQGISSQQLKHTIRAQAEAYWRDPERHRLGRADIEATRRMLVQQAFLSLGINDQTGAIQLANDYSQLRLQNMYLFPQSIPVLEKLRIRGHHLALITNGDGPGQRRKIERFGLAPFFELILVEGETGYGKPDTRIFKRALEHFNVQPHEALMAGDNIQWDVQAPLELGMRAVWVNSRSLPVPSEFTAPVIDTIAKLPDLIESM